MSVALAPKPASQRLCRDDIVAASRDLIAETGAEKLSMRALARTLGCDPMAIYYHLPSKAGVLDAVGASLRAEWETPPTTDDWPTDVLKGAHAHLSLALRHPKAIPLIVRQPTEPPTEDTLEGWSRQRLAAAGLPADVTLPVLMAAINGVLFDHFARQQEDKKIIPPMTMMTDIVTALCTQWQQTYSAAPSGA